MLRNAAECCGTGGTSSGIDRTPYKTDRKISFVSYHTRSISMNITRAEAWQLHKAVNTAKGNLCRHRDRNPTGGA